MKLIKDFDVKEEDIVIFAIGAGAGGSAAIDTLVTKFPRRCVIYGFEARELSDVDTKAYRRYMNMGVRVVIVNKAVAKVNGKQTFYVNKCTSSSSLLPPSPKTINDHIVPFTIDAGITTWGENTELDKKVVLDAVTLFDFIEAEGVVPNIIIADVQGMEYGVMIGLKEYLYQVNALFTEVEFYEIYKGQGLFEDQSMLYRSYEIRLAELYGMQRWHPGPAAGGGLLTVAEALWLRTVDSLFDPLDEDNDISNDSKILTLIKQVAIGYCYGKYSYAYAILERLCVELGNTEEIRNQVRDKCDELGFNNIVKLWHYINANMEEYKTNNKYFLNDTGKEFQWREGVRVER